MKLSDYVVDVIAKEGVSHVFEFIGGAIVHILDSISNRDDIECVSVRHEQAGAFAAEAYARINGKLGVAMATSGPGALNLLTGIGSCYFDSVPCLFITGQVNTYEYKFDRPVRQIGFQETDIVSVARPLTKYAELVTDPNRIRYSLEKAVFLAQSGRPGPVLLDIPMNLQRTDIEPEILESFFDSNEYKQIIQQSNSLNSKMLDEIKEVIANSKRPVILAGGGIRAANASKNLEQLSLITGIPVVTSLMGIDAISHSNSLNFGMIGSYGNRYSNLVLANCDLLIILGSRLDSRQTGTRPDTFARGALKIHVDIDENELNAKVKVNYAIHHDVNEFLISLNEKLSQDKFIKLDLSNWYETFKTFKNKYPTYSAETKINVIEPNRFIEFLSSKCKDGDIISLDVGQHQMWASQSFRLKPKQRLLNSGGMGAMGFSLPAAIGATLSSGQDAIVIAGDGGFQVNIQELDTIVRLNLPIKIFVLNNSCLGMVRQFQDIYFNGRQQSTMYQNPDFVEIARAYGIVAYNVNNMEEAKEIIPNVMSTTGPVFVEVKLEKDTAVNPKLVVNRPIEDMYPHLEREELKEIMLIDLVEEMEVPK
ncbi:thiamine pyrophosphate-binding protein [Paenibacillus sp. Soil750]|uniref:thiamine pyrophosphate-binding protein n=1 Tax=Paenibacillus sp. Soil750 TaxID=1736398 RepID=UPI0006FB47F6|nr:thiamine pyrophosphate-binding protein [Paenibacillus sp. Soil750]KRE75414.1 acetolactate synthase [Paenibacillus sp. Soil750]